MANIPAISSEATKTDGQFHQELWETIHTLSETVAQMAAEMAAFRQEIAEDDKDSEAMAAQVNNSNERVNAFQRTLEETQRELTGFKAALEQFGQHHQSIQQANSEKAATDHQRSQSILDRLRATSEILKGVAQQRMARKKVVASTE